MKPKTHFDLSNFSFDEFISFLFDHEVPPESAEFDPWYWHMELDFDAIKICAYYIRLFRQPKFLLTRFTKPQLDKGFWAIHGPNLDCSVSRIIDDTDLPLPVREECIDSMANLFKLLFAEEPLDGSVNMWWDSLCYDWHCENRKWERGGEDLELQNIFFRTLGKVLAIESWICQEAALHGLGHLHHPGTTELIEQFVLEHPALTSEQRKYAGAAAKFEVE